MQNLVKLILIVFSFSVLSCQSKEEPVARDTRLNEGSKLIDEGKYDEAIEYFHGLLQSDAHHHVKLALASAYAAKAGVKIEQIYSFVNVRNLKVETVHLTGLSVDEQTQNLMKSLMRYADQWQKIPAVSSESRVDLAKGLAVLSGESVPGARLYAATLRVVLLKSVVNEGIGQWKQLKGKKFCSEVIQPYFNWALNLLDHLILLSRDLQGAYPEQSEEFAAHERELKYLQEEAEVVPWPREQACY